MKALASAPSRENGNQRDPILRCAAGLFRRYGYAETTTRQIAQEMGLQKGTLYHYFQKKEDILLEISQQALRSIADSFREAVDRGGASLDQGGALSAIRRAITVHVVNALADLDLHAVMLVELKALSPESRSTVIELRKDYELMWESLLDEGIAEGVLRADVPARYLTLALLNLLNWTIFWFRTDGELSAEQWATTVANLFLSGALSDSRSPQGS